MKYIITSIHFLFLRKKLIQILKYNLPLQRNYYTSMCYVLALAWSWDDNVMWWCEDDVMWISWHFYLAEFNKQKMMNMLNSVILQFEMKYSKQDNDKLYSISACCHFFIHFVCYRHWQHILDVVHIFVNHRVLLFSVFTFWWCVLVRRGKKSRLKNMWMSMTYKEMQIQIGGLDTICIMCLA